MRCISALPRARTSISPKTTVTRLGQRSRIKQSMAAILDIQLRRTRVSKICRRLHNRFCRHCPWSPCRSAYASSHLAKDRSPHHYLVFRAAVGIWALLLPAVWASQRLPLRGAILGLIAGALAAFVLNLPSRILGITVPATFRGVGVLVMTVLYHLLWMLVRVTCQSLTPATKERQ